VEAEISKLSHTHTPQQTSLGDRGAGLLTDEHYNYNNSVSGDDMTLYTYIEEKLALHLSLSLFS
jgi:hypothetical protein